MCSFLTPNIVLKIILDALFEFKSKGKYERKMLNRLKRNFKRKICINSFWLMLQVLFFFGTGRWTNGKRMKQNKSCLKMMLNRLKGSFKRKIFINSLCLMSQVLLFFGASRWTNGKRMKQNKSCPERKACSVATWTKRKGMYKPPKIYNRSDTSLACASDISCL